MEESIKEKESLLVTDTALIERLTEDASGMFDTLIIRLEQYAAVADGGIGHDALTSIPANAARLGINEVTRLTTILEANGCFSSTDPATVALNGGKTVAPIGTPKIMTEQSKTIPKFTWAAASTNPEATQPKASLVDIQKEELISRNGH
jgi:hypothetical protein